MQSRTSWFNPTLFRKNLTRFWPIWVVYGAIWLMSLPGHIVSTYLNGAFSNTELSKMAVQNYVDSMVYQSASTAGILLAFVFGCIAALAVFSYLYQHRSAVAFHAFPLRRECLFLTNYLSGLAFFLLPLAAVFVLTAGAELLCGALNLSGLLVWFTAQVGYILFFYSFAVFCAMFTGNAFAMPAFYGILSILAPAMCTLVDATFQQFVYGYVYSSRLDAAAALFSPLLKLYQRVNSTIRELDDGTSFAYMTGWGWILLYALVGVILAVCALLVYRRRQVETAGDVVSVSLVRPVFQYGVAVCSAFTFGTFTYSYLLNLESTRAVGAILALLIVFGVLGYFVAQMLLSKSFRVFSGHWRGAAVLAILLAVLVGFLYFDPTGLVSALPAGSQVKSAVLSSVYAYPHGSGVCTVEDAEGIAQVLELHQAILDQRSETQRKLAGLRTAWETETSADNSGIYVNSEDSYYFKIEYVLTSGRTTIRGYDIYVSSEELADPDSPAARLTALLNRSAAADDPFGGSTANQVVQAELNLENQDTGLWDTVTLDQADARVLFAAVQEDLENGAIGRCWLIQDQDYLEHNYTVTIDFSVTRTGHDGTAYLEVYAISPQTTSSATLAALEELDVFTEGRVLETVLDSRLRESARVADAVS